MRKPNAYIVYLIQEGAFALIFWVIVTVDGVYQVTTGVVADAYSRKLPIVIGMVLIGLESVSRWGLDPRSGVEA